MQRVAAVTICSINYLGKASVLVESYQAQHPGHELFVVLVDRKAHLKEPIPQGLNVIWAEELGIADFEQAAFAFDVIEFNTNVKPAVLKKLLNDFDFVLYLDPDIEVFAPLEPVFSALRSASIVVTPHTNTPVLDGCKPDDLEFMKFGTFNLGFVGVSRCDEAFQFLDWWSERCLKHGFYEPQAGLAVDQKWISLAPSYFRNLRVLHDEGLNVAFWNLHERTLSQVEGKWMVNSVTPLRFVHFSSFNASRPEDLAQKQDRFKPGSRPDFEILARLYAAKLMAADTAGFSEYPYSFDYFEDGVYITPALRRFYAALQTKVFSEVTDPFSVNGPVREFAKQNGLLVKKNAPAKRHNFRDLSAYSGQMKIINKALRIVLSVVGPERYFNLMRYLAHISSLRNQAEIFQTRR